MECGEEKPLEEFKKFLKGKYGRYHRCKPCVEARREASKERTKEYKSNWYQAEKERLAAKSRKRYEEKKEEILRYHKKHYQENKERINKRSVEYQRKNKEAYKRRHKNWRDKNKEKLNTWQQEYRVENPEKVKKARRKYENQRREEDHVFHICRNLRINISKAMQGKYKRGSTVRDMGCTGQELCDYLETFFDSKMTWGNYGKYWHVDHVYPLAAANVEDRVEFLAVVNWRNLQPLEGSENKSKNDEVTPEAQKLFNKLKKEFSKKQAG